ncbi:MAG: hypothetical protein J7L46_04720 [Bacteroidales bacterium]|nr:hypothetical protein [Bacteroidales bacterium]
MNKAALFFSYLFHPLFLPLIVTFLFFNRLLMTNPVFGWIIYGIIFFNTLILPYLFYRYMDKKNALKPDGERKTIILSLTFNLYCYLLVAALLKYFGLGIYMESFFWSIAAITLFALVINFFWKISLHLLGIGGVVGFILSYIFFFKVNILIVFVIGLLISAFVAASRLRLNAHSPAQVYTGFLLGIGLTMGTTYLNLLFYFSQYFNQIPQ